MTKVRRPETTIAVCVFDIELIIIDILLTV